MNKRVKVRQVGDDLLVLIPRKLARKVGIRKGMRINTYWDKKEQVMLYDFKEVLPPE